MPLDRSSEPSHTISIHSWDYFHEAARRRWHINEPKPQVLLSYRQMFGDEPIQLGNVEFLILLLLASRPYHPFTRDRIAVAVTTEEQPVAEEDIDQHIASLRDQLGFFHDFVQTVQYVGYRFKA